MNKEGVDNILLIQLGDIGDVVYTLPCARALKENFPHAQVVIAVQKKARGLGLDCPWVDEVIVIDKTKRSSLKTLSHQIKFWQQVRDHHFDLAIDVRTGSRGAIIAFLSGAPQRVGRYTKVGRWWRSWLFTHLVFPEGRMNQYIAEYYLDTIAYYGIMTDKLNPVLQPQKDSVAEADRLLRQEGVSISDPILAIQPFSLWGYKEWAIDKFIELIRCLQDEFAISVILTGSPEERSQVQLIARECMGQKIFNLAGKTPIELLPALLQKAVLFVGVDSAGLHIAAAVGTPTVSLYGPSASEIWAPKGEGNLVISKKFPCLPCKETGCQGTMKSRCMDELTVDEVLPSIHQALRRISRQPLDLYGDDDKND